MKKFGLKALMAFALAIGLVGCGDDGSSGTTVYSSDYCKVVSEDPLTIKQSQNGVVSTMALSYEDGKILLETVFGDFDYFDDACMAYRADSSYSEVTCADKKVVAAYAGDYTEKGYRSMARAIKLNCENFSESMSENQENTEPENNSSAERSSSSSVARSSSSEGMSSFEEPNKDSTYCKVLSEKPLVYDMVGEGHFVRISAYLDNGTFVNKYETDDAAVADTLCMELNEENIFTHVDCGNLTVAGYLDASMSESDYREITQVMIENCNEYNEYNSSSSSSSEETYSSSSVYDPEETWDFGSSSSEQLKEKVVAVNADELTCLIEEPAVLDGYDVAYEFNDATDLGRDYLGKNAAYMESGMSVSAECGSLVLDGTSGLNIPLSDTFKNRGFVVEIRFMPMTEADNGNIFVAEPPGGGVDGWLVRLNGKTVNFYFRDANLSSSWSEYEVGEVSPNEWHVVRIKIFPTKSETGSVFYSLNASLDGDLRLASEIRGDASQLEYGLGIGYDSMHQGSYSNWFFIGKIDYIRYGKITEDNLQE